MKVFIACIEGNGITSNRFLGVFTSKEKAEKACKDFDPEMDDTGVESWIMPTEVDVPVDWLIDNDQLNP